MLVLLSNKKRFESELNIIAVGSGAKGLVL